MKYDKEELEILEAIEGGAMQKAAFNNDVIKSNATETMSFLKEKKQISIT